MPDRLARQYSIKAALQLGDLSDPQDLQTLVDTITQLPALDALVNNASYAVDGRLISVQGWNYKLIVFFVRHLPMRMLFAALGRSESARSSK